MRRSIEEELIDVLVEALWESRMELHDLADREHFRERWQPGGKMYELLSVIERALDLARQHGFISE